MKLLLKAALRTKRHFGIVLLNLVFCLGLLVASQMELFGFGLITRTDIDFFKLFGDGNKVTEQQIEKKWPKIAEDGVITRRRASAYLLKRKQERNPLTQIMIKAHNYFENFSRIELLIGLLVGIAIFKALMLFFSRYVSQVLSIRISKDLRQQYFEHIQKLPLSFYQKFNIGALSARVGGDASQIALSLNSAITNYFQTPFTILSALSVCLYISWRLSLVIFIGLPLIVLPVVFVTRKVKQITRRWQKHQERFSSVLIDFLSGIKTVKIFSMEKFSMKKYEEQNNEMARLETKTAKYDLLTRPILHTITMICLGGVIFYGLYILKMNISELLIYCGMLHLFYEPVKKFAEENTNIQKGVVAAERLFEVLNMKVTTSSEEQQKEELTAFNEKLEFENVWFRYDDRWILKDLSFTIHKGETVAIIGATGAGKSTIVELIPRLHEVQKGEIRIDGKPLSAYSQKSIRKQIAFVSQKPFLFFDSIKTNISYGKTLPEEEVREAAKRAYADEFIEKLPQGYLTHLAETGKNLSGGQQQRLAIARALAKKAPILILDEATSALDSLSEQRIQQAIEDLHGEHTQIIIAHRLTTIEHADRIIFLEDGTKIAEGTKDELLASCTPFRLMWETHFLKETLNKPDFSKKF
ncbi:MAG: ABC transporter ATP-binding protein [Candidatus Algichlamydia australiensis]|nr:ABC transporter ATP-binding protein [Chlamydiales bacterium]